MRKKEKKGREKKVHVFVKEGFEFQSRGERRVPVCGIVCSLLTTEMRNELNGETKENKIMRGIRERQIEDLNSKERDATGED